MFPPLPKAVIPLMRVWQKIPLSQNMQQTSSDIVCPHNELEKLDAQRVPPCQTDEETFKNTKIERLVTLAPKGLCWMTLTGLLQKPGLINMDCVGTGLIQKTCFEDRRLGCDKELCWIMWIVVWTKWFKGLRGLVWNVLGAGMIQSIALFDVN